MDEGPINLLVRETMEQFCRQQVRDKAYKRDFIVAWISSKLPGRNLESINRCFSGVRKDLIAQGWVSERGKGWLRIHPPR